ncbi:DUF4232 domain-containing protein [Streptomyces noursei]|uniref:DUF4232 domain-containing protein n=1 Tax=Streptomyces noursei TaxID=1971 RepID=UPI001E5AEC3C|nr:DUF4232 domain-containing protein [Streptomyces noursei]MCZ1013394.1 DUF4232 domain-containing protein [Streptomyces noursei]
MSSNALCSSGSWRITVHRDPVGSTTGAGGFGHSGRCVLPDGLLRCGRCRLQARGPVGCGCGRRGRWCGFVGWRAGCRCSGGEREVGLRRGHLRPCRFRRYFLPRGFRGRCGEGRGEGHVLPYERSGDGGRGRLARPEGGRGDRSDDEQGNKGGRTCSATGFAGVDLKDADGTSAPVHRGGEQPRITDLKPGGTATFSISYAVDFSGDSLASPTSIIVTPPNETHSVSLKWPAEALKLAGPYDEKIKVHPVGIAN